MNTGIEYGPVAHLHQKTDGEESGYQLKNNMQILNDQIPEMINKALNWVERSKKTFKTWKTGQVY